MHLSVKLTGVIWVLQLLISSPLIHALGTTYQLSYPFPLSSCIWTSYHLPGLGSRTQTLVTSPGKTSCHTLCWEICWILLSLAASTEEKKNLLYPSFYNIVQLITTFFFHMIYISPLGPLPQHGLSPYFCSSIFSVNDIVHLTFWDFLIYTAHGSALTDLFIHL